MRIKKKKHGDQSIQINNDLYDLLIGCKKYRNATHIDAFFILCVLINRQKFTFVFLTCIKMN